MAQSTTPNIAQWDWNPGTTFIGAAKVAHGMMMANQESERLQQKQTLDEEVKRTLLPYEIEESKAKVALSMAQRDYALSRARDDAKTMTAASIRAAAYNDPEAVNKGDALLFGAPENRSSSGGSSLNLNDTDINSGNPLSSFSPDESSDVFEGIPSSAPTVASSPAPAQGSAPAAESEPFLTSEFNPATSLSSPELSQAPKELTTSTEGGPMVFNSSRGNKALRDQADIKRLAKSGDTQAASFVNPLGDSPSTNPLYNFNVPTSVKEMERTLAENKDAFAGPKQKAPESLSSKISSFNSVMGNAEKKLRTLKQANPAAHIQGSLAYQERYSNFLEDNFKGMDSDEVRDLMKNPSKADRYMEYKSAGAATNEANWLSGIATTDAKAIVELKTNGTIHGKPLDGIPTIESFGHAKDVYDQYKKQLIKPTEDKSLAEIAALQGIIDKASNSDGTPKAGMEGTYDNALSQLDKKNGTPTGTSKYSFGVNRLTKQKGEFENAQAVGAASYGDVPADQFGATISGLQSKIQEQAIKFAPTFKDNSQKNAWLSNPETAGLPFFMFIDGKKALLKATEDPNVMERFVAQGKSGSPGMLKYDFNKKPTPEKTDPESEFTGAGEVGQRVRRAVGRVVEGAGQASQSMGNTLSDIPYQALNAASGVAEFGAGVAGYNLDIPKVDTMTEAFNKLGLDNRNDFARGKSDIPTAEQIRKDQEMIAKRKK